MAFTNFFALLDDIASVMDDVALLAKISAQKTGAVVGDDLALNAKQLVGLLAQRELPVVYEVSKGSLKNKIIIVPCALLLSAVAPWVITPLLMVGGIYLCFEGAEKVFHVFGVSAADKKKKHLDHVQGLMQDSASIIAFEQAKIKSTIKTDFILSAEIVVIALGIVAHAPFITRCLVLSGIAVLMTVVVYGLVALIIKMDDVGFYLQKNASRFWCTIGEWLLILAPMMMKFLSIAGTAAMFLVGGGIITHSVSGLHHWMESWGNDFLVYIAQGAIGLATGVVVLACNAIFLKWYQPSRQ